MKLTFICLTAFLLQVSATGVSQNLTLSGKQLTLEKIFSTIKEQSGYSVVVNKAILQNAEKVTIDAVNIPLDAFLKLVLKDQKLAFLIESKSVFIYLSDEDTKVNGMENNLLPPFFSPIIGTIRSADGVPLAGATVRVKGKSAHAITNEKGVFSINTNEGDVLLISYIGYQPLELTIKKDQDLKIVLQPSINELDEVIAQGYGKTTQRLATSSINRVTAAEIERQPVSNPLLALQGKVPGLILTPLAGYSSGVIKMQIRGRSALENFRYDNPLIVINGTPLMVASNSFLGSIGGEGPVGGIMSEVSPALGQSPLFGLDPKDIESIEVLVDAGATAIYGSRGANGVILITTKKGKVGTPEVSVRLNSAVDMVTRRWDMLNTPQYLQMRREAFKNDGITPTVKNAPDLLLWDSTRYTDWQDYFWGNTGKTTGINMSVSGGTPNLTYNLAGNYSKGTDIMQITGGNEIAGMVLSMNQTSSNQKFKVGLNLQYTFTKVDMIRSPDPATLPPNAPDIWDEEGNLNFKPWNDAGLDGKIELFGGLLQPFESKSNSMSSNLSLNYTVFKGFSVGANIGYNNTANNILSLTPSYSQNPKYNPTGSSILGNTTGSSWNIEPILTYTTSTFGRGNLSMVLGANLNHSTKQNSDIMAMGYTDDNLLRSVSNAAFIVSNSTYSAYKYAGVLGMLDYVWDNKYILKLSGRRDGSSRFGPGNRYGNFGSVGAGWIISEENWFKSIVPPIVSYFKLRANYGTTGLDGGGDYEYLSQWGREYGSLNYNDVTPIINMHATNQKYHWATSKQLTIGAEFELLKNNKLRFSVDYYNKRVDDQLVRNETPRFTGFPSVFGNWAALVVNTGWELKFNTTVLNTKNFNWSVSANGGFNKNVLKSFPGIEYSNYYTQYLIGDPITTLYMMKYLGVDPATGQYQVKDYNNNGNLYLNPSGPPLSGNTDYQNKIDLNPKFSGGLSNSFKYKQFGVYADFYLKVQKGRNVYSSIGAAGSMINIPSEVYDNRWQKPGDHSKFARLSALQQRNVFYSSDLGIDDASFLRLTNLSLSYNLSEKLTKKMRMKAVAFSINTQNLFIITKYKGIDPESQQPFGAMPPARRINGSLNLTF